VGPQEQGPSAGFPDWIRAVPLRGRAGTRPRRPAGPSPRTGSTCPPPRPSRCRPPWPTSVADLCARPPQPLES